MAVLLEYTKKWNFANKVNATDKARRDVIQTLKRFEVDVLFIPIIKFRFPFTNRNIPKLSGLSTFILSFVRVLKIRNGETVYIQYPALNGRLKYIYRLLKKKKCKIILIIHDIESLRRKKIIKNESYFLGSADLLYVHTDAMKAKLRENGIYVPVKILTLFDYYSNDSMLDHATLLSLKNQIAFAGNLIKSLFIPKLLESSIPSDIKYVFYGIPGSLDFKVNTQTEYITVFNPDNPGIIKAGWGLVWDGDSIETCNGELGEYLMINSSHKISLYLSCGIPLIIWSKSSLYNYVIGNNLGIVIDSLNEIPQKIKKINDVEYIKIIKNVEKIGKKLRDGEMLASMIK